MHDEFRFHIEMETDQLIRTKGLAVDEARRQALAAFGGVEKHKEAVRDGRGLAWLSGMSLDGGAIGVLGRLASGVSREQANTELRVFGERTAAAFPATHEHLRPRVMRLGEAPDGLDIAQFASRNVPVLLVLMIACMSVGTLVYARTATREGEIAVRSALGAGRARIMGQLFVEALVLASVAAAVGLIAADRALTWGIENVNRASGGTPFWMTPGLKLSTILYAGGLAVASAVMLSFLPALKVTRASVQPHLANRGATLRFGRVWTGAMIVQVALTAIGIPVAMETASQAMRKLNIRAAFPSREYLAARIDLDRPFEEEARSAFDEQWAQTFAALEQRIAQEPGVVAITFADHAPGSGASTRFAEVESFPGAAPAYEGGFRTSAVGPGFFEAFDRPIVAGRAFHGGDWSPSARTVIVNEAFAREFSRDAASGSPVGARLRYPASSTRPDASAAEPARGARQADTAQPAKGEPGTVDEESVSRRTREIGLRVALGAHPRHLLAEILSRAVVLMGSGITAGGALLLWSVALGQGPSGRPADDVALFAGYLGVTSAVMLAASLLACIGPAKRALRINPSDALKEA